jgi:hypothetical protein
LKQQTFGKQPRGAIIAVGGVQQSERTKMCEPIQIKRRSRKENIWTHQQNNAIKHQQECFGDG